MAIQSVRQLCDVSDIVSKDGLVDQIANLDDLHKGKIDPDAFFRRNHFTEGLSALVRNGFDRLSGRTGDGAFYLSQSMGGGKTHSLIAFALLAQDDGLRHRIIPNIAPTATFGSAKVVIFNGHQNPSNFLWGEIADRLGRPEAMARFWKNGAKTPGVDDWVATLGEGPVLILLDELPSYLQMAEGQAVGNSTLADITIGALERLFNALSQLPRACVVVTNLIDDVFAEGSGKLKTLINTLNKQYGKYAQAITPVQQNSGEVFQIIRKKLFDKLPDGDVIEEIAQAYVDELNRAKKVDDVPSIPESFIARIRETYPFHPSIRDIVARFKENPRSTPERARRRRPPSPSSF
jgi:predicted AAA+ superfamily ATPase